MIQTRAQQAAAAAITAARDQMRQKAESTLDFLITLMKFIPTRQNPYNPWVFVTMDVERGLRRARDREGASNPLTEIGFSRIALHETTQGPIHPTEDMIHQTSNLHIRIHDHGRDFYPMAQMVDYKGSKTRFGGSEWVQYQDVRQHIIDYLMLQINAGAGYPRPRKLILFAWDKRMEMETLTELDIDPAHYFEHIIDIQELFTYADTTGKLRASLRDAAARYSFNLVDAHNGLNDSVYEYVVLLHLLWDRAGQGHTQLSWDNTHTAHMKINTELFHPRFFIAPRLSSTLWLPMPLTYQNMCNVCGSPEHKTAKCDLFCDTCEKLFNYPPPPPGKPDKRHAPTRCT